MKLRTVREVTALLFVMAFAASDSLADPKPGSLYHSPLKNFDVTVPKFNGKTDVKEHHDEIHGWLACVGAYGDVSRIGYQRAAPEPQSAALPADSLVRLGRRAVAALDSLPLATLVAAVTPLDPSARKALAEQIALRFPGLTLTAPGGSAWSDSEFVALVALNLGVLLEVQDELMARYQPRVVSREAILRDGVLMALAISITPSESGAMNMTTGKPIDAVYAHLVFIRNSFCYILAARPNDLAAGMAMSGGGSLEDKLGPMARKNVFDLYQQMTFH
jgi:hypothetical protein